MPNRPSSPAATDPEKHVWVESLGGPLIVVPLSAVNDWRGGADDDLGGDYGRACAVDGWAGALPVGDSGAQALVLGDIPAASCYLPGPRVFVRWNAADSEADLLGLTDVLLTDPQVEWEDCGSWETAGPAVLMDSVVAGVQLGTGFPDGSLPDQSPVPIAAGRWQVRASFTKRDSVWVNLVRLRPEPVKARD